MENKREKLRESWKNGYKKIKDLCNFETVRYYTQKKLTYREYEFTIDPGMYALDVEDNILSAWLWLNRKTSEEGFTGEEYLIMMKEVEDNLLKEVNNG